MFLTSEGGHAPGTGAADFDRHIEMGVRQLRRTLSCCIGGDRVRRAGDDHYRRAVLRCDGRDSGRPTAQGRALRGDRRCALGVEADFQGALNLRWKRPAGPPINFGVVQRNGQIWTETVNAHAPPDIAHRYIAELASAFSMQVDKEPFKGAWQVRDNNQAPRIEDVADKLDLWITAIEHFIAGMKKMAE
jgi:hypothetical protein